MGPAQHGRRTWTLLACTAVLCAPPLTAAAADDVSAPPSAPSYTAELPDGRRLSITVELPGTQSPVPESPAEHASAGGRAQHNAPPVGHETPEASLIEREPAGEERHLGETRAGERARPQPNRPQKPAEQPAVPSAEERFTEPPAADPAREATADTEPGEPVGPGDGTSAREDRTSQSTAKILPVLTLGAGLASIGLGLGFLAIRLRRR